MGLNLLKRLRVISSNPQTVTSDDTFDIQAKNIEMEIIYIIMDCKFATKVGAYVTNITIQTF